MQILEQISALHDDAGSREDLAALPRISADPASCAAWARFQTVTDLLDDADSHFAGDTLQRRVAAAIADEPTPVPEAPTATILQLPPPRPARRWPGMAVAASVLMAALTGWYLQSAQRPGASGGDVPVADEALPADALPLAAAEALPTGAAPLAGADPAQVSSLSPAEYQRRINSYLVNFNEQRAQMGAPGVHPYVRVVGFENAPEP